MGAETLSWNGVNRWEIKRIETASGLLQTWVNSQVEGTSSSILS
jgi:hypothetical protein